jgi:solute carrier family 25 phosphate transporter 23/24/25/41
LSIPMDATQYRGMWDCAKKIYKEEGRVRALFRGLSPTIIGIAPYVALNFTTYETLKARFKDYFGEPTVAQKLVCGSIAGITAQTGNVKTVSYQ